MRTRTESPVTNHPRRSAKLARLIAASAVAATGIMGPRGALAGGDKAMFSPLGLQKALVIPIEYPKPYCPVTAYPLTCPKDVIEQLGTPRNTAGQWEAFLNTEVNRFYRAATYKQTWFSFKVLANPARANGWWFTPHTLQEYWVNATGVGDWVWQDPPPEFVAKFAGWGPHALGPDVARDIIDKAIGAGVISADEVRQYHRLVILESRHAHTGTTYGGVLRVMTSKAGELEFTAHVMGESFDDFDALGTAVHELGHQFGLPTHYGDCTSLLSPPPSPKPFDSCLQIWDVMGKAEPDRHEFTAYSSLAGGWLTLDSVATVNLGSSALSKSFVIRPIELKPTPTSPNAIRIPVGWPGFATDGYYVECREQAGIDRTIPAEGLLITSAHPGMPGVPALHVVRETAPTDRILEPLHPGERFVDAVLGLTIAFDGYVELPPPAPDEPVRTVRDCKVSIDYEPTIWVNLAILRNWERDWFRFDDAFQSQDIWIDSRKNGFDAYAGGAAPGRHLGASPPAPLGDAPWTGHVNRIWFRVHNTGNHDLHDVVAEVRVSQPEVFRDACGAPALQGAQNIPSGGQSGGDPPTGTVTIPLVAAGQDASAFLEWTADSGEPARVEVRVQGGLQEVRDADNVAASTVGFLSGLTQREAPGEGPGSQETTRTVLRVARDASCEGRGQYAAVAAAPPGWKVRAEPEMVTLEPGAEGTVTMTILAPDSARAGTAVRVPVALIAAPAPSGNLDEPYQGSAWYLPHVAEVIGGINLLSAVQSPASLSLVCPATAGIGMPLRVSGALSPAHAGERLTLEYASAQGQSALHTIATDKRGGYADQLVSDVPGPLTIKAYWEGDTDHRAADSSGCVVAVASGNVP